MKKKIGYKFVIVLFKIFNATTYAADNVTVNHKTATGINNYWLMA